jgi:hypothetical protein
MPSPAGRNPLQSLSVRSQWTEVVGQGFSPEAPTVFPTPSTDGGMATTAAIGGRLTVQSIPD